MLKRKFDELTEQDQPQVLTLRSEVSPQLLATKILLPATETTDVSVKSTQSLPQDLPTTSVINDMPPPPTNKPKVEAEAMPADTAKDDSSDDEYASDNSDASSCSSASNLSAVNSKSKPRPKKQICTWPGCTKRYNRPTRLESHMRSHTGERPFSCTWPGCSKTYIEAKHLTQHIEGKHENKRNYACPFPDCGRAFFTSTRLSRHVSSHIKAQQFQCKGYPNCKQVFRRRDTLNRHVRQVHLQLPGYTCPESNCTEAFASSGALRNHRRRAHGELKHFCDECKVVIGGETRSLGFTTISELRAHFKSSHMTCSFCSYRCTYPSEMDRHVSIHHSTQTVSDRKTVACDWPGCNKKFTKKSNLNAHKKSSHEGYRYVCGLIDLSGSEGLESWNMADGCREGFVTKANLESHVRHVHLGMQRGPTSATQVHSFVEEVTGVQDKRRRNLLCKWCSRGFIRYHDLQVHKHIDHPIEVSSSRSTSDRTNSIVQSTLEVSFKRDSAGTMNTFGLDPSLYAFPGTQGFVSPVTTPSATPFDTSNTSLMNSFINSGPESSLSSSPVAQFPTPSTSIPQESIHMVNTPTLQSSESQQLDPAPPLALTDSQA